MLCYREDFDTFECACPSCRENTRTGEIYLHSGCHPASPTWAHVRGDVLTIECATCKKRIVSVVIASRAQERREFLDDERCP